MFYAKLMRADIQVQKHSDYAAAARVLGYDELRIIFRHLLPNAITPIIVYWMTDMALALLLGSSLGYLGLGAQPPTAEWGVIIADGKNFMSTAWWISGIPRHRHRARRRWLQPGRRRYRRSFPQAFLSP